MTVADDNQDGGKCADAAHRAETAEAARRDIETLLAQGLASGLYIVSTPIGHLGDITLRALAVLAGADVIYCEDTRHSRVLTDRFHIKTPLRPYHEHNAAAQRPDILAALGEGKRVALITDAGTPLVSDPGFKLVREAVDAGFTVVPVPGASAVLAALTVAGLPSDLFLFVGFLPAKEMQRRRKLEELKGNEATLVLYEAPNRLAAALYDARDILGDRPAVVARELTKMHESVSRGRLSDLTGLFASQKVKGECVIVIAGQKAAAASDDDIIRKLRERLQTESVKDASRNVSEELKLPRGRVYDLALNLKGEQ